MKTCSKRACFSFNWIKCIEIKEITRWWCVTLIGRNKRTIKFDIIPTIWKVVRNFGFWCIINHIQSRNVWIIANVTRFLSWFLNKVYDYERKNRETDRLIAGIRQSNAESFSDGCRQNVDSMKKIDKTGHLGTSCDLEANCARYQRYPPCSRKRNRYHRPWTAKWSTQPTRAS